MFWVDSPSNVWVDSLRMCLGRHSISCLGLGRLPRNVYGYSQGHVCEDSLGICVWVCVVDSLGHVSVDS